LVLELGAIRDNERVWERKGDQIVRNTEMREAEVFVEGRSKLES